MKKMTKRIMALMLSFMMILGCVPSFINEASANEINTIADVLATVEFPTTDTHTNIPVDAWVSSEGGKLYKWDNNCLFCYIGSNTIQLPALNEHVSTTEGGYIFTDSIHTTFKFVMTGGELTSIIISNDTRSCDYVGTYKPVPKTLTVNYEQPTTVEELGNFADYPDAITVDANATSISTFRKILIPVPLYLFTGHPDLLGYFGCITILDFEENIQGATSVDSVYLRDINLGKPESLDDIMNKASTIDYAAGIDGSAIWVIEKFDFSKKLNITASLNANMKVEDAIKSITDDLTDDEIEESYYISEEFEGDSLADDATLEAGKKYYLHGEITKVKDSIFYNQVTINGEILPNVLHIDTEKKPDTYVSTGYDDENLTNCGFIFNYEFTVASNSSSGSSKKYKASDSKDTAEKISGSGKKGSTRTITPIEGKKVSSVIVTDKDGNKVDVTLNEDGTYSFKQPASDVNIEVNYKNREITLNIGSTEASVDGEKSNLDVCPVIRNDRTMLPIRYVAENLGAKVEWNEKKPDYVAITRGDTKIEITLGSDIMLVNGKEVKLDSVAFAENDRTYLPVRAISEALNAIVEWNESEPNVVKIFER